MSIEDKSRKGYKTIRVPLQESEYRRFVSDGEFAKQRLSELYQAYPELFPEQMNGGYVLCGLTSESKKQGVRCRRIKLKDSGEVYTIAPGWLLPGMSGRTEEVEQALLLRKFNVPFWALVYIFGRNEMYWYRLESSLGNFSVVGTTVKAAKQLPQALLADEKHSRRGGKRCYIAMTAGEECILGAAVSASASEADLTASYQSFADEVRDLEPNYAPQTVNTDGWAATQLAWQHLFPTIQVILCFLHAFIKIRERAIKALRPCFKEIADKVWEAYRASSKASFSQRLRRLREWTEEQLPDSPMKAHTLDLCAKRARFICAYEYDEVHRTSNMIDRLMRFFDRLCFDAQYFHGTQAAANQRVRAMALLWNFCPSAPATVKKYRGKLSPAERLNGFRYADSWLENLLVSASRNGFRCHQQKTL